MSNDAVRSLCFTVLLLSSSSSYPCVTVATALVTCHTYVPPTMPHIPIFQDLKMADKLLCIASVKQKTPSMFSLKALIVKGRALDSKEKNGMAVCVICT